MTYTTTVATKRTRKRLRTVSAQMHAYLSISDANWSPSMDPQRTSTTGSEGKTLSLCWIGGEGVLLPSDEAESIIETAEIMADKELFQAIKKSQRERKSGKAVSWKKAKEQLGL